MLIIRSSEQRWLQDPQRVNVPGRIETFQSWWAKALRRYGPLPGKSPTKEGGGAPAQRSVGSGATD